MGGGWRYPNHYCFPQKLRLRVRLSLTFLPSSRDLSARERAEGFFAGVGRKIAQRPLSSGPDPSGQEAIAKA